MLLKPFFHSHFHHPRNNIMIFSEFFMTCNTRYSAQEASPTCMKEYVCSSTRLVSNFRIDIISLTDLSSAPQRNVSLSHGPYHANGTSLYHAQPNANLQRCPFVSISGVFVFNTTNLIYKHKHKRATRTHIYKHKHTNRQRSPEYFSIRFCC